MSLRTAYPNLFDKDDFDAESVDEELLGQVSYFLNLYGLIVNKNLIGNWKSKKHESI